MPRFIRTIDGVFFPGFCREVIDRFEQSPHRGPGETESGVDLIKKRSTDIAISNHAEWRDVVQRVNSTIIQHFTHYARDFPSLVAGTLSPVVADPETGEPVTLSLENFDRLGEYCLPALTRHLYRPSLILVQKYTRGEGGYPHWHSEVSPQLKSSDALHRVLFWIAYLNDVNEGGETEFLHQGVKVQPKAGRLLIAPTSFTHTHRGNVPLSGDKYILTSWLLFQKAEKLYRPPRATVQRPAIPSGAS